MLICIGGAKEIESKCAGKHLSSPAWVLIMGKYGARGEIQAPACASFLFRPSLPVALAAGRQILASHSNLQARVRSLVRDGAKTPSITGARSGPIATGSTVRLATHTQQQIPQPHTKPAGCPYPVCSLTDRQLLTRRIQRHLEKHIIVILSVQSSQTTRVAQPRVAPLPWLTCAAVELDSFNSISNFNPDYLIESES